MRSLAIFLKFDSLILGHNGITNFYVGVNNIYADSVVSEFPKKENPV